MGHLSLRASLGSMLFATLVAASLSTAHAQNAGVRAELDAIKAELGSLREVAAGAPTMAQALQELSSKVVVIEQTLEKDASVRESMPAAVDSIDGLETAMASLRTDLEYLRTAIANIEQPAVAGGSGIERKPSTWQWTTGDGEYNLRLGGYMQPRYETQLPSDFSTQDFSTFRVRRARVELRGDLGERLSYATSFEFTSAGSPLTEMAMDMRYSDALKIRVGQSKVPFARSVLSSDTRADVLEASELAARLNYDRDLGVWAIGSFLGSRLHYQAGISNGAGLNRLNDNVDMVLSARVDGAVLGEYIEPGFGDYQGSDSPRLTLGGAAIHDLVRVGEEVSGIEVGNRDVDGNGILDNVRVVSGVLDAQFRYKGFEAFFEGNYRHERWGTILDHEDNSDLAAAVKASDLGRRNYLGFALQGSYFILPQRLQAGTRISHGRLPLLGVGGQRFDAAPAAQRLFQSDVFVHLWRDGYSRVGMNYSFLNFNEIDSADPADDKLHQLIVQAQLIL